MRSSIWLRSASADRRTYPPVRDGWIGAVVFLWAVWQLVLIPRILEGLGGDFLRNTCVVSLFLCRPVVESLHSTWIDDRSGEENHAACA